MFVRALCIMLLCSAFVSAQKEDRRRLTSTAFRKSEVVKQNISDARWRFGNLYVSPIIGLRQLGYDNNVFSTETAEVDDFSLAPQIGVQTFYRPGSRWVWENRLAYDYLYYVDLDNLRGSEYSGETRLYGMFKRAYVDFGAKYQEDRQRLNSEIKDRITSQRMNLDVNYSYQPSARTMIAFNGRMGDLDYDETEETQIFRELEREETRLSLRYHYRMKKSLWPFIEVERLDFDFKSLGNIRDDTTFDGMFLGVRTEKTRRLSLEGKAGITSMDFQDVPFESFNEDGELVPDPTNMIDMDDDVFSMELFFRYKLSRRHYLQGSVLNAPLFSIAPGYTYFISGKQSLEFSWETRRKIRMGPEVVLGTNDYKKTYSEEGNPLREDELRGLNFNISFPLRKIFELRLSMGYLERDSNLLNASDKGYQIGSTVRYRRAD